MNESPKRSERGFLEIGEQKTRWHGNMRVKESSVAFEGPCFWIFADLSYSNEPKEHTPCLHLNLTDARFLRDALARCIQMAEAGLTCEKPEFLTKDSDSTQ